MEDPNRVSRADMALIPRLLPYSTPDEIPIRFTYGDRVVTGIPADFKPHVTRRLLDCNLVQIVVEGTDPNGLTVRAEYIEYRDFPVTEWVAYITNKGSSNTPILSDIKIIDCELIGADPVLMHG
ncbi:MAG: hypothetical protein WBJ04_00930, partial [Bacillota bacterium]